MYTFRAEQLEKLLLWLISLAFAKCFTIRSTRCRVCDDKRNRLSRHLWTWPEVNGVARKKMEGGRLHTLRRDRKARN